MLYTNIRAINRNFLAFLIESNHCASFTGKNIRFPSEIIDHVGNDSRNAYFSCERKETPPPPFFFFFFFFACGGCWCAYSVSVSVVARR